MSHVHDSMPVDPIGLLEFRRHCSHTSPFLKASAWQAHPTFSTHELFEAQLQVLDAFTRMRTSLVQLQSDTTAESMGDCDSTGHEFDASRAI